MYTETLKPTPGSVGDEDPCFLSSGPAGSAVEFSVLYAVSSFHLSGDSLWDRGYCKNQELLVIRTRQAAGRLR